MAVSADTIFACVETAPGLRVDVFFVPDADIAAQAVRGFHGIARVYFNDICAVFRVAVDNGQGSVASRVRDPAVVTASQDGVEGIFQSRTT